jgi:hypothetical protein
MDENPVLWMASRRPLSAMLVYAALFAAGVVATAIFISTFPAGPGKTALVASSFVLHAALKLWVALEASRRFAEDARSGALELLLVTPMAERTVAMGWIHGLKRLFLAPVLALLLADFFLLGVDSDWVVPMLASMGLLLADVYTLCWVGMWMGLRTGTATSAALRTVGAVLVLPYLLFAGLFVVLAVLFGGSFSASPGVVAALLFGASYLVDMSLCVWAIDRVDDDYRAAAGRTFGGH